MTNELTDKSYWDSNYEQRESISPVAVDGAKNLSSAQILRLKQRYAGNFGSVLEIGGGGSAWLAYLALEYPQSHLAAIDYSDHGSQLLSDFARTHALENIRTFREDFFESKVDVGLYEFVYSHGVVEHFSDLAGALMAHAKFLSPTGTMFTMIPNLAGILGPMIRWMNTDVYDIHVVHDLSSFVHGHRAAGLDVVESGYLCSSNFGVLSSCVRKGDGFKWFVYKQLSRLSKAVWFFEYYVKELPATRPLAPYIYVVSRK